LQYRLTRFGIHSVALIAGIIYFILAIICIPPFYLISRNAPNGGLPGIVLVIGPVFYGIFGYVATAISCWIYNLIASWTGGMVLTLAQGESASV
jgi:hypothetical protein